MQLPFELLLLSAWSVAQAVPAESNTSIELPQAGAWSQQEVLSPNGKGSSSTDGYTYKCFHGDLNNYPDHEEGWLSWRDLWDINREQVLSSNGGDTYIQHYVLEAILSVAKESAVDARLILAAIMQESKGKANVDCVEQGSRCGIMHALKGAKFDEDKPKESLVRMIRDGIEGRSRSGPGFAILLNGKPKIANLPLGNPYAAARMYNSGEVGTNLDVVTKGEAGYANDLANRLIGWDGRGKGFKSCQP